MGNKRRSHRKYYTAKRSFRGNKFQRSKSRGLRSPDDHVVLPDETNSNFESVIDTVESEMAPSVVSPGGDDCDMASEASSDDEDEDEDDETRSDVDGNRIISLDLLQEMLSDCVVCCKCKVNSTIVVEEERFGLATTLTLQCDSCGYEVAKPLSAKTMQGKYFDINRSSALALRLVGDGREDLSKICGILNIPPPVKNKSYLAHCKSLLNAARTVAEKSMSAAAKALHVDGDGPTDIAISTDGTWMKPRLLLLIWSANSYC